MKIKTIQLSDNVRSVLLKSKIDGKTLTLPGQLPRDEYEAVAKAIKAAGGKWSRKDGCHIFPADVKESMNFTNGDVAVTNVKQTYQSFFTPDEVANQMVEVAAMNYDHTVLEPSAGKGAIIKAIERVFPGASENATCIELDHNNWTELASLGVMMKRPDDFLLHNPEKDNERFQRILMNPPFTKGQDVAHIKHAIRFLAQNSRLVAICSNSAKAQKELKPLAAAWVELPAGTFSESGTSVATVMLTINS